MGRHECRWVGVRRHAVGSQDRTATRTQPRPVRFPLPIVKPSDPTGVTLERPFSAPMSHREGIGARRTLRSPRARRPCPDVNCRAPCRGRRRAGSGGLRVDVLEDVLVVHFTRARFIAIRHVADLEVADLVPRPSMCATMRPVFRWMWYMSKRILQAGLLTARHTAYAWSDVRRNRSGLSLSGSSTIVRLCGARMSAPRAQRVEHVPGLDAQRQLAREVARHDRHPLRSAALRDVDAASRQAFRKTSLNSGFPVASETFQLSPPSMTKTPIVIPRLASRSPIACCSSTVRAIMPLSSNARESVVGHEPDLVERIVAGRLLEHADVRRRTSV